MSSCSVPPRLLLLLLLLVTAAARAGPVDPQVGETTAPQGQGGEATVLPVSEVPTPNVIGEAQQVLPATLVPAVDGQSCVVDGAVYHNGARLPLSPGDDPCRACYCQGGEPVCTRLHCYRRPDCAPRHVAGRCCPKYDSCPPAPEDRPPEPRFKDASTQTDSTVAEVGSTVQLPEETITPDAGPESTDTTTVTTPGPTGEPTDAATSDPAGAATEDSGEDLTSSLPPGIDLHALHDHLPFLSPGNANGPNT